MAHPKAIAVLVVFLSVLLSCGGQRTYKLEYRSTAPDGRRSFAAYRVFEPFRLVQSDYKSIGYTFFLIEGGQKVVTLMGDEAGEQSITFLTAWWAPDSSCVTIVYCPSSYYPPRVMTWYSKSGEIWLNQPVEPQFGLHVQEEYSLPTPPPLSWACEEESIRLFDNKYLAVERP